MRFGVSDRVAAALLTFIKQFVHVLSKDSNDIEAISLEIPKTLYSLNKIIGITEFVACSKCHKLHKFSELWQRLQGVNISKKCNFKQLLELVKNPSGKTEPIPFKKYCYVPLIETIKKKF